MYLRKVTLIILFHRSQFIFLRVRRIFFLFVCFFYEQFRLLLRSFPRIVFLKGSMLQELVIYQSKLEATHIYDLVSNICIYLINDIRSLSLGSEFPLSYES